MIPQMNSGSYFGVSKHLHDCAGLTVCESCYPSKYAIPAHEHENSFFCFVLEGVATRSWPGRGGSEQPMSLTLFPRGHAHANHWAKSGRVLHLEFSDSWLEQLRDRARILDQPADFDRGPPVWIARRIAAECAEQDSATSLMMEGLALELLAECSRSAAKTPDRHNVKWLKKVCDLLHENFANNLSLQMVSAEAGVSADHLIRVFRRHYGCSIGEYVRRLRTEYVCEQLIASETPIADLAIAAGFTDQSHLTKVFKRQMGVTPAMFRSANVGARSRTKR